MSDLAFTGAVPETYQRCLVPLIFEPYAADLARRAAARAPMRVLEVACGTGVVTRRLAASLAPEATIVATDLNAAMVDHAASLGAARAVDWRVADALALPFDDASFDLVVCQFGAMFFPDRPRAYAEARRVLRAGGAYLFNSWDRIENNEFADVVTRVLGDALPDDPPRFLARTPHGYHDVARIAADVVAGGFDAPRVETIAARSRAASASDPAAAYCLGTPLRGELEARAPGRLAELTALAAAAIAARFGPGPVDGAISAHVVEATIARHAA